MKQNHSSNDIDFCALAQPGVRELNPYLPGKPISELERELGISNIIKLASNENPLGASPQAVAAAQQALEEVELYPDANGYALKQKLMALHGVGMDQITLGNGSNDVLVLLAETFLAPGQNAVMSQYCFAVYPIATQAAGADIRMVDALPESDPEMPLGHDLAAMLQAIDEHTRLVFVANPNNPTGTGVDADALRRFIAAVPSDVIVVVDEAYTEYVDAAMRCDASEWLAAHNNLVVTRTFSKAYGLAGLRVGYALSHPQVADLLNRIRQPFNVNSMALAAAAAALDDDQFIAASRAMNAAGMQQLQQGCRELGLVTIPSRGNFVLVNMGGAAEPWYQQLLRSGVITRRVGNYGLPNHLRITIGTGDQNERLLDALKQIAAAGARAAHGS
ncbi:MAG: histidinol-phosphate transaminase [Wenzhouxiangellaceae bacterium]